MAARKYKRDRSGKFAGGGSYGDRAETVQQNKAKKTSDRKRAKDALSGARLGGTGKRKRSGVRSKVLGAKATTKRALRAAERSRKRYG